MTSECGLWVPDLTIFASQLKEAIFRMPCACQQSVFPTPHPSLQQWVIVEGTNQPWKQTSLPFSLSLLLLAFTVSPKPQSPSLPPLIQSPLGPMISIAQGNSLENLLCPVSQRDTPLSLLLPLPLSPCTGSQSNRERIVMKCKDSLSFCFWTYVSFLLLNLWVVKVEYKYHE